MYCDRVLTAALIQWAVLVYAKLAKPAFEDITIPEQVVDNYDILWDEKAKLFSGDHADLPKESACYGLNPRGYDEVTKRNFKIIKQGEFTEWKRVYAKDNFSIILSYSASNSLSFSHRVVQTFFALSASFTAAAAPVQSRRTTDNTDAILILPRRRCAAPSRHRASRERVRFPRGSRLGPG
jgi:hypothetical protein